MVIFASGAYYPMGGGVMSPVFGAVFLWISATILWWSGWREEAADGIPQWAVGVFLSVWPLALLGEISITPALDINGAWIWTWVAYLVLARRIPSSRRWISISVGVLLGSIYLLLNRLAYYPSGFSHFFAPWGIAVLVGWLSAILLRPASEQLLAISTAIFLNEGITTHLLTPIDSILLNNVSEWMENWWIAVLSARLGTVLVRTLVDQTRRRVVKLGWRRRGQRS
jgi:hypothetical protein